MAHFGCIKEAGGTISVTEISTCPLLTDKNRRKLFFMGQMRRVSVRLSEEQVRWLKGLSVKLQIEEADVHRLAITRLAQWEGVAPSPPVLAFLKELLLKMEQD